LEPGKLETVHVEGTPKTVEYQFPLIPCVNSSAHSGRSIGESLFVPVKFGSTNVQAVIDTGSPLCFINQIVYNTLLSKGKVPLYPCKQMKPVALNGGHLGLLGYILYSVRVGSTLVPTQLYVLPDCSVDCIVGTDFLRYIDAIVSFPDKTLYFQNQSVQLVPHPVTAVAKTSVVRQKTTLCRSSQTSVAIESKQQEEVIKVRTNEVKILRREPKLTEVKSVTPIVSQKCVKVENPKRKEVGKVAGSVAKNEVSTEKNKVEESLTTPKRFVYLTDDWDLPPQSENLVRGHIDKQTETCEGIFEPKFISESVGDKQDSTCVFAARSLNSPVNGHIPVHIMNVGKAPVTLRKGTRLGLFEVNPKVTENNQPVVCMVQCQNVTQYVSSDGLPPGVSFEQSCLSPDEKMKMTDMLKEFWGSFSTDEFDLGATDLITHSIDTGDSHPVKQQYYRVPFHQRPQIQEFVDNMLNHGLINHSNSPWASPLLLRQKKDGSVRFCVDFRKLNNLTKKDAYPMPFLHDFLDILRKARYYSSIDLSSGFHQVKMTESDKEKTAFSTFCGLFQYNVIDGNDLERIKLAVLFTVPR